MTLTNKAVIASVAITATFGLTVVSWAKPADNGPVEAAYAHYLDAIGRAQTSIDHSAGVRPGHEEQDRREGSLFLQSVIDASVTWALLLTPDTPIMSLVPRPSDRLGLDNPDNLYYTTRVSDAGTYVLSGKRGSARTFL